MLGWLLRVMRVMLSFKNIILNYITYIGSFVVVWMEMKSQHIYDDLLLYARGRRIIIVWIGLDGG